MGDRVGEIMGNSVDSVSGVDGSGERLAVLIDRDGLGQEGVQERVGIKSVQLGGGVAVDLETREVLQISVIRIIKLILLYSRSRI